MLRAAQLYTVGEAAWMTRCLMWHSDAPSHPLSVWLDSETEVRLLDVHTEYTAQRTRGGGTTLGKCQCIIVLRLKLERDYTNKCKCRSGCVKVVLVAGVLLGDGHLAQPELHHGAIKLGHLSADVACGAEMEKLGYVCNDISMKIFGMQYFCIPWCLMRKWTLFTNTIFECVKYRGVCSATKTDSVTLGVGKWTTGAKPDLCQVFRVSGERLKCYPVNRCFIKLS